MELATASVNRPMKLARAIAPEMASAIKQQIALKQEAMSDALYPIIGSTILKYIAEMMRDINEKLEKSLSPEGITRKFKAKVQGISEAELLMKETTPLTVKAVFLIHAKSGLLISGVQPPESEELESEMIAGMLTAIRSFVNDCISQSGNISRDRCRRIRDIFDSIGSSRFVLSSSSDRRRNSPVV